jgi:DNA repair protein SbcC/Rad50
MILDRLILRNFKRFRDEEIHFRDGITGILGNNGTGKSSLVQAIFFALYGVQATGIAADYIVSSFAGPKDKCEVRLDFRNGGEEYAVVRTFRKGKTVTHEASFYHNKKMMATGVSQVEDAVKRTLGMGPVDFKNTIYAGQKDLLTLLENTPGKRKEWFLRALGIDYLNTESQKILKEQIDARDKELQGKEGELKALAGRQSEEEFANLKNSLATFTDAIAEHTNARDQLLKKRAELDGQQKVLAEQNVAYNRLLQQQQALRQELAAETAQARKLETALALVADEEAEYHRIEKTAGSYAEVRAHLDHLHRGKVEHNRLCGELGFASVQITDLEARIQKQQTVIRGLDADAHIKDDLVRKVRDGLGAGEIAEDRLETSVSFRLKELNKNTGTLAARLAQYKAEREKIEADQKTIRNAGADGVCPVCRQKLGSHFGTLDAEFAGKLEELADKAVADLGKQEKLEKENAAIESLKPLLDSIRTIASRLKRRAEAESEIAELDKNHQQKMREKHALDEALAKLAYNEAAYKAAELEAAHVQKVQARFIELGKKIGQAVQSKQQHLELTKRIALRNAEIANLEKEIAASAFDPAGTTKIETAITETGTALRDEEVAIANAVRDKKFAEEKIANYKRAGEQIAGFKTQAARLRDEIELLKITRSFIAEFVVYLMQVVRSRIEGEVSRIISEITGGRYEQVLLDEDFNLLVRDVDNDYPIDRFSGGEQDDIAVALRIALSRYLAELHDVHESTVLIFDEIFGSQDDERRANLLTALRTQESRFPQILLISHIAEIQGEFANTFVVETSAGEGSRVREVE